VENAVDATLRACVAPDAVGKVINVGVGESYTLNRTIALLDEIFARRVTPRYDAPRAGDVRSSQACISLARQTLGYEPKIRFEEGLRRTVAWFRETVA
jgi:UDP-glucose 4-epimerase